MLTNMGAKADLSVTVGAHNVKAGGSVDATPLHEQFTFAITDPTDSAFADAPGNFNDNLAPFAPRPSRHPVILRQA